MNARAGFTLAELLIAATLILVLAMGLAAVIDPSHATSRAQAAATDIRLRLRATSEALSADLHGAGSGPVNGAFGRALGAVVPTVLPFCIGSRGHPAGSVRTDALSAVSVPGTAAAAELADPFVPGSGVAQILAGPGCPAGDASCGVRAGASVLLADGRGQSDFFNVTAVAGARVSLAPRGPTSGRPFPAGSLLIPVTIVCYYLDRGTAADGLVLMAGDGDSWSLPLVDRLTGMAVDLFGETRPPRLGSLGTPPGAATYGPPPPADGVDDVRDLWPAGENCVFQVAAGVQQSRMPVLPASGVPGLAALTPSLLTDGPWCPDAAAPNRYDADLLRVRAIRVTVRAEARSAAARGVDARLFLHPGTSSDRSGAAADREVVFDVVPRPLQAGR